MHRSSPKVDKLLKIVCIGIDMTIIPPSHIPSILFYVKRITHEMTIKLSAVRKIDRILKLDFMRYILKFPRLVAV